MRWKSLGGLAVVLLALAADASARQAPTPPPPPGPANFSGRVVVDSAGTPIRGAFVELVGTVLRCVTDSSGAFSIIEVPAGTYVVRVRATGFLEELFEVEVVDGEDLEGIIALKPVPPGAARGELVTAPGAPIPLPLPGSVPFPSGPRPGHLDGSPSGRSGHPRS